MSVDPTTFFPRLSDSARLWVFGVSRPLLEDEEAHLLATVDGFLDGWKAHGRPLSAAREWAYGRFLLVGMDDVVSPPSGCSIDALVRALKEVETGLGVEIVGSAPLWYRDHGDEEPRRVTREEFRAKADSGEITGDTLVFDLTLTRIGELRGGRLERRARDGWHDRYFR